MISTGLSSRLLSVATHLICLAAAVGVGVSSLDIVRASAIAAAIADGGFTATQGAMAENTHTEFFLCFSTTTISAGSFEFFQCFSTITT